MEELGICTGHSFLYQWYAIFLELNEKWRDAHMVYQIGISRCLLLLINFFIFVCRMVQVSSLMLLFWANRKAEPLDKLEEALALFIDRLSERLQKVCLCMCDFDLV